MKPKSKYGIKQDRESVQAAQLSEEKLLTTKRKKIFIVDHNVGVSKFRFYLLRIFYFVILLLLGIDVWTKIFTHKELWQPLPGVAYSFWGALSILSILGLFHPLKMLPLLLMQFSYKLIWLIIVAYPLWLSNQLIESPAKGITTVMAIGILVDLFIIPWSYVFKNYVLISKKSE